MTNQQIKVFRSQSKHASNNQIHFSHHIESLISYAKSFEKEITL